MIFEAIGTYYSNCYLVGSSSTKEAAIIDPGSDFNGIDNRIKELGLSPKIIILTHAHGDHIGAVMDFVKKYGALVYIHKDDAELLKDGHRNFSKELSGKPISIVADVLLHDKDVVKLGELNLEIIHTPGHTNGGICIKVDNIMMTGDTLFNQSIGRTDFPGGSFDEIIKSIKERIFAYDDDIIIYPGHNSPSTIRAEKRSNPFVAGSYR